MSDATREGENAAAHTCRFCGQPVTYERVSDTERRSYAWVDAGGNRGCTWQGGHDWKVTFNDPESIDYDAMTRPEWDLAEKVGQEGARDLSDEDVASLAAEVLRLRDHAMEQDELWRSHDGYDLRTDLEPRIRRLIIGANAESRGEPADIEGGAITPERKWNNLVELTSTAAAGWLANARWAVIEHRDADRLREAIRSAERAILGGGTNESDQRLHEALAPLWAAATEPDIPEETVTALTEQRKADVLAVLTVYDEHVPVENRGPWRDRLHRWASRSASPRSAGDDA